MTHDRSELHFTNHWDTSAVRSLIDRKTRAGRKPAFLFLGRHEAELLRERIGANFGPDSVRSLRNHYYHGLEVIELDTPAFLRTAGMKRIQSFRTAHGRNPRRADLDDDKFWRFSMG